MRRPTSAATKAVIATGSVLAAGALALGGIAVTGAVFTSQATVSGQSVTTATVEVEAGTKTTSAPIAATNLLPGDTESTTITLENTGSVGAYYRISLPREVGGDDALASALQVTVAAGGATTTQTLATWQGGSLQVGPALASGAAQDVTVSVTLPSTAGDELQGTSASFAVLFDAIQERNTEPPTAGWAATPAP